MKSSRIYIIAGESSGDAHGALLMREIHDHDPMIEFYGAGGSEMKAIAGGKLLDWTQESAVVGVWDVAVKWSYFKENFKRMADEIRQLNPDAVIFVDYPGFNLRMVKYLRRQRYAGKLIYYISPQVWAWNRGRIPVMARVLDLMMCIFPFEKRIYEASGLRTEFVGHPMVEELARYRISDPRDPKLIALLPGSRNREIRRIFPIMLQAAKLLRRNDPSLRFEASATSPAARDLMQKLIADHAVPNIEVEVGNSKQLMQRASVGMVASGTATIEASFFQLPFVLVYKVSWLTYIPGRLLIRVDHLGMPNILAGKEIVPEFIQHKAVPERIAQNVWKLYSDSAVRDAMVENLNRIVGMLRAEAPRNRPAEVVLRELATRTGSQEPEDKSQE
jgi:lipid-A-disaccharide synthase